MPAARVSRPHTAVRRVRSATAASTTPAAATAVITTPAAATAVITTPAAATTAFTSPAAATAVFSSPGNATTVTATTAATTVTATTAATTVTATTAATTIAVAAVTAAAALVAIAVVAVWTGTSLRWVSAAPHRPPVSLPTRLSAVPAATDSFTTAAPTAATAVAAAVAATAATVAPAAVPVVTVEAAAAQTAGAAMPPPLSPRTSTDDDGSVTWLSQRVSPSTTLFTPHPPASWATFIDALSSLTSASPHPLGVSFVGALAGASPAAFAWECPPFTAAEAAVTPVQWAVVALPALDRPGGGDPSAFRQHLRGLPPGGVATFANLRGDATLVVPARPDGVGSDDDFDDDGDGGGRQDHFRPYAHIGAFVRGAPPPAVAALWAAVGDAVASRLVINGGRPLWLSTAGLGVPWLHVRLDDAPKYYKVEAYRALP